MNTAITEGVKISVRTTFRPDLSNIEDNVYLFNYKIEIENQNPFPVRLTRRHWRIMDSLDHTRFVDGDGVIGEQPTLYPGEIFAYRSACDLSSEIGFMDGFYEFEQLNGSGEIIKTFSVEVPRFRLIYPFKLN
jgi:ApaG protein